MKHNWEYKKLGDVASFRRGLTYAKDDVVNHSSKIVLRSNNITLETSSLNFDDVVCLRDDFIIPMEKKLHSGDIFICMSNGSTQHLGKVAYVHENLDMAFGGFMGVIEPNKNLTNSRYVFYCCRSGAYRSILNSIFNGANINNLKWSELSKFVIPVPSLSEQSRIVAELDLLTGIIDKQNAQLKELDNLAQAIFYDMFGDPIENPKRWDISSIKDLAEKYTDGPFGSNLKSEHYQQFGVRIIRLQNIGVNEFVDTDQAFISEEHYKKLEKYTCYPGDIVIGTLGEPNLRACIVPLNIEKAVNKADCVLCRVCKERISEIYLCRVLNNPKFVSAQCQLFSHGQTRARISAGQLKNACIPLPPLALQQSFAEKIQSIEKQKEAIRASIADTQKLLDYTMDKYFG